MAYNSNIPKPSDKLKNSQGDLLANFQALKTLIDVNHGTFGAADEGKHKWVTLPEQSSNPTTAANEMAFFTKDVAGVTQLFLKNESDGDAYDITSATKSASNGTLTLPSGIIIKWGQAATGGSGAGLITYTTAFPNAVLAAYAVPSLVSGSDAAAADYDVRVWKYNTIDLAVVAYGARTGTRGVYSYCWFAIGY